MCLKLFWQNRVDISYVSLIIIIEVRLSIHFIQIFLIINALCALENWQKGVKSSRPFNLCFWWPHFFLNIAKMNWRILSVMY